MTETITGTNRSAGVTVQDMIPYDTRTVPDYLSRESIMPPGPTRVPVERYISKEFHDIEVEKLWMKVWQMACHEDDIPDVGDYLPYEIADKSFLIVRSAPDEIKAFKNACLHRGRLIKERPGKRTHELRCPFHAWAWHLDGKLKEIPCQWDFPHVDEAESNLPEIKVGRWGGFIFINPDPECESFENFLGDFPENFQLLPYEKRYKLAEVRKVIKANWKVAQDAFAESWHVFSTHPQMSWEMGDCNAQFDAFENYSRQNNVGGGTPHLMNTKDFGPMPTVEHNRPRERHPFSGAIYELREDGNVDVTMPNGKKGVFNSEAEWIEGEVGHADIHLCHYMVYPRDEMIPPSMSELSAKDGLWTKKDLPREEWIKIIAESRAQNAQAMRDTMRPIIGDVVDEVCDGEMTGNIYFNLFPNLMPCSSFTNMAVWFRFRPNGSNPEECIMESICIAPIPEGEERPSTPPQFCELRAEDSWTKAPVLGFLASVLDQDSGNMPFVQQGIKNLESGTVQLADYNEMKLRHFYKKLDEYLAKI